MGERSGVGLVELAILKAAIPIAINRLVGDSSSSLGWIYARLGCRAGIPAGADMAFWAGMAKAWVAGVSGIGCGCPVAVEKTGRWANAIEVPSLGALNTGGQAEVFSVSCASAGNCAAGGYYAELADQSVQGFVVSERNGVWGTASEVPGLAALNTDGDAAVSSVSCASAGNCTAGGYYGIDSLAVYQGFVVSERNGRWGQAIEVPGLAKLSFGMNSGMDQTVSVSCASAGNCAAGGDYTDRHGHRQGFVANQT